MSIKTAVVCAIVMACAVAHGDPPRETQKIAITAKPSVVKVWAVYTGTFEMYGQRLDAVIGGTGTGWFMTPDGYIATNAHVVETIQKGEEEAKIELEAQVLRKLGVDAYYDTRTLDILLRELRVVEIKKRAYVVLPNGDKLDYKIKSYGRPGTGRDAAILKVDTTAAPTLPIGDSSLAQVEDRVVVIGFPGVADLKTVLDNDSELEPSITDGSISALKTAASGEPILQISAPITHGNSGGPALDGHGNVIGLVTFSNEGNVQGFNFLVAASTLQSLVHEARIDISASETSEAWRAGLEHYWRDEYTAAIDSFEQVHKLFPPHTEASHMVQLAKQAQKDGKEKVPASSRGAIVGAILAVVVLVPLIVLGIRAVRRAGNAVAPVTAAPAIPVAKTVAVSLATVECIGGSLAGQRFTLSPAGVVVGRQPGVQIQLYDPRASGKHVWIGYDNGQLVAYDYGTTNGTYINDVSRGRITRAPLRDGDVVIVGFTDCLSLRVRA